ncbi:MAG TPA: family 16 glycosylhydrolase [Sphingobacteriaceae bacterium]
MKQFWFLFIALSIGLPACKTQRMPAFREVYSDKFSTLNSGFWEKATHTFANNLAYFKPENISFGPNGLQLKVLRQRTNDKRFSAAELRSIQPFTYGKFTVRMKAAHQQGIVSAFFLYSPESRSAEEIDIEFTGNNTSVIHLNYWRGTRSHLKTIPLGFDAAKEYHDYSIVRLPGEIRWEVDGKEIYRATGGIPRTPLHLMINLWPSKANTWAGKVSAEDLPAQATVKYVKVYSMY